MKKFFFISVGIVIMMFSSAYGAEPVLKAVTENWPPYFGKDLKDNGPVGEIAKEAYKRAGYDFQMEYMPWNRAVELAKRGQADLLVGAYYSEERAEKLAYPDEIVTAQDVLFAKKGKNIQFSELKDLSSYKIGVVIGAAHGKSFDGATFLKKDPVKNQKLNIKKFMADRIDLMAGPKNVLLYEIKNNHPELLKEVAILAPPLNESKVYVCVSKARKDHETLVFLFNEKLAEMKADGTYDAILKKHGFN